MKLDYIANQLTPEGIDEVQRCLLARVQGAHIAISGPPGVGKTHLVGNFASITRQPIAEISCADDMTESPIVGYPALEGENGSTITVWKDGVAVQAARSGGIFYGDEFDALKHYVQKRLDPLLDDRRRITRRDGEVISAKDGFMAVITYNPTDKLGTKELADAVADRFFHMVFSYPHPELEAALAREEYGHLKLETRAVLYSEDGKLRFLVKGEDGHYKDFFKREQVKHTKGVREYDVYDVPQNKGKLIRPSALEERVLTETLAEFFKTVRTFSDTGTTDLPDEIKSYLAGIGQVTRVPLHKPSTRILRMAYQQYKELVDMGMDKVDAQAHAARVCIDQICYGRNGSRELGDSNITLREHITAIAEYFNLIPKKRQRAVSGP